MAMSHCGLGHSACNPVLDTIAKFRPAYDKRMAQADFTPAFDLDQAPVGGPPDDRSGRPGFPLGHGR